MEDQLNERTYELMNKIFRLLGVFFVIRLILGWLFPLTADESYYWLWSKHLSLSYIDHPPMIAYINYLFTLGHENLFMIRLGANIIVLLTGLTLYWLTKKIFDEEIAFWSTVLFLIIPHYLIIWLTQFVELPLALFWLLSIFLLYQAINNNKKIYWLGLTITLGLGYLSKYTMMLFWPALLLYVLMAPEEKIWFRRKEPYLTFIGSLLFFIPVLWWNSQHQWASFVYQSGKLTSDPLGLNILSFIGDQLVHFSPFILFLLFPAYRFALKRDKGTKLLLAFSLLPLMTFFLLSFKVKVWAHWPAAGYLTALPLIIAYLAEYRKSIEKYVTWLILFTTIIMTILFWITPAILAHQDDYQKNYNLAQIMPKETKIFARTNVSASLLEFYSRRPTYLATGFFKINTPWGEKQYDLWGIPELKKGESVLYFGEDNDQFRNLAQKYFGQIEVQPAIKLYLIEDYIVNNYKMFLLKNYKRDNGHP